MSADPKRSLVAEAIIGLSIVLGCHFMIVEPMRDRLNEDTLRRDQRFVNTGHVDPAAQRAERDALRASVDRVARAAELSADELVVMERLNKTARGLGLEVRNIEKRVMPEIALPPAASPSEAPAPTTKAARHGFSITTTGDYASLVRLVDAIRTDFGLADIDAVRLTPEGDEADPRVTALITTTHWWLDTRPAQTLLTSVSSSVSEGAAP